ncbi:hypothetical protein ACQKLP_00340 [Chitinophaga sp. NPDC101104]|uniref:hypothetical protein n=1 Tax=Chitinophaga sp. NPDC101104 TaxID=3390561 RepID=UPI003D074C24
MKPKYLLPHVYKKIGWWLAIPAILFTLCATSELGDWLSTSEKIRNILGDATEEVGLISIFVGLLLISFSREKDEDEYISRLRLESLQLAVIINYILLIIATLVFHWLDFLAVMIYNMFTVLVIFIIRFNFLIYRQKKSLA